jgi:hypothetical protein
MKKCLLVLLFTLTASPHAGFGAEELITTARFANGDAVPYILDSVGQDAKYVIILFPGGSGVMNPRMQDGKLVYGLWGNFLLRARQHFVDADFSTVSTNATDSEERIQAVLDDIARRFPKAKVYLAGTSNGTHYTMKLAGYLQDRIAGEIHSSSRAQIYWFDARQYRNRHLVIHHVNDWCRVTPYSAAVRSHEAYGNDFIAMEGGISTGNDCEAFAHHGFNGIERETAEEIKAWIRKGP